MITSVKRVIQNERILPAGLLLSVLFLAGLLFLGYTLVAITFPYSLDYGEAPLVDQALRLAAGQNIYRPDLSTPPYTIANYPPLYVLTLSPFTTLFGPSFLFGRLLSTLSALAVALFLGLIITEKTDDRLAALITSLLFLAIPFVTHWSGLLRIDLLALALSTAALALLVRRPPVGRTLVIVGLLLAAAIFTRQSYALAAPLAAFVWLGRQSWKQAFALAGITGGVSLLLFLLLNTVTQGGFFFHIVTANVNDYGLERLEWNLRRFWEAAPLLTVLGALYLIPVRWRSRPLYFLLAPYLVGAFLSALTVGKIGSNINYFLELCAALSLAGGALLASSRVDSGRRPVLMILLAIQSLWLLATTFDEFVWPLAERRAYRQELVDLADLVGGAEGAVLADEEMGMLVLNDRRLYIQPFEITQLAAAGLWDQEPFLMALEQGEFPLVLIFHHPDFPLHEERWTPEMLAAVRRRFTLTNVLAHTHVYRPRGERTAGASGPEHCSGAPWPLPTTAGTGVARHGRGIDFFGAGPDGQVPVYAVADGRLFRAADWSTQIAILHPDPLQPGEQVWSVYADMAGPDGTTSIDPAFPPGTSGIPVTAGQLLGYQGSWGGRAHWPVWMHLRFGILPAETGDMPPTQLSVAGGLDVVPYLGLEAVMGSALRPLACDGGP